MGAKVGVVNLEREIEHSAAYSQESRCSNSARFWSQDGGRRISHPPLGGRNRRRSEANAPRHCRGRPSPPPCVCRTATIRDKP